MTQGPGLAAMGATITIAPLPPGRRLASHAAILCPPDKSVTHRCLILAAMAQGESRLRRPLLGADCLATMGILRALGVTIAATSREELQVSSPGWDGWQSPTVPLDCANSGTTARLLTGVFAASPQLFVTLFGDASLSQRPMARVVEPLRHWGAHIAGREGGARLPLAITGQALSPGVLELPTPSAQVKSALILAALNLHGETTIRLPAGSRDHTERLLRHLGAPLTVGRGPGGQESWEEVRVNGPFRPPPWAYDIPGDPSSAAFWLGLGALLPMGSRLAVRGVMTNPTRLGFLRVLQRMGANLTLESAAGAESLVEPVAHMVVDGGAPLHAATTTPDEAPTLIDEIPLLAVVARAARGTSRFCGLGELRVKESNRLNATIALVRAGGGQAWAEGDDLLVAGDSTPVRAFDFDPAGDHRLAMSAAMMAKVADGPCRIAGPTSVEVSYPGFFDDLSRLG